MFGFFSLFVFNSKAKKYSYNEERVGENSFLFSFNSNNNIINNGFFYFLI
jgi:hypothetical protein